MLRRPLSAGVSFMLKEMSTLPATRLKRLVVPADPGTSCGATRSTTWSGSDNDHGSHDIHYVSLAGRIGTRTVPTDLGLCCRYLLRLWTEKRLIFFPYDTVCIITFAFYCSLPPKYCSGDSDPGSRITRGTILIVNRTHDTDENLYISLFLAMMFVLFTMVPRCSRLSSPLSPLYGSCLRAYLVTYFFIASTKTSALSSLVASRLDCYDDSKKIKGFCRVAMQPQSRPRSWDTSSRGCRSVVAFYNRRPRCAQSLALGW